MLNGMCTIEMIENLKIKNSTKMWVCAISPYERRYVLMQMGYKYMYTQVCLRPALFLCCPVTYIHVNVSFIEWC